MSAPKNIQRDAQFIFPDATRDIGWSADWPVTNPTGRANSDALVQEDFATVHSAHNTAIAIAANNTQGVGVNIRQPIGDRTAYRIKARAQNSQGSFMCTSLCIGYALATPTGTNDIIDQPIFLPFDKNFDDLVIIEALSDGDTFYGRALTVAIVIHGGLGFTHYINAHLSVQNLGIKPPTMQYAVS